MIVEAAVLVVGDDQQALVLQRRIADRRIDIGDQILAAPHAIHGMLRRAAFVGVVDHITVIRFDERVGVGVVALQVRAELGKVVDVERRPYAANRRDLCKASLIRSILVLVEAPTDVVCIQQIVDRAVRIAEAIERVPQREVRLRGHVIEPVRRSAVNEEAVGPGWARHGGKPLVAYRVILREVIKHWQPDRRIEARHDVADVGRRRRRPFIRRRSVIGGEAAVVHRGIIPWLIGGAAAGELLERIGKLVPRVGGQC
jgi:hypothetical protein